MTNGRMSYISSLLLNKCPRCRKGDLFKNQNPYVLKKVFDMHDHCPVCGQKTELEIGFWYGTGYVSYVIAVLFSLFNLAWYWLIFGISWRDDSVYHWLITNGILLALIMPGLIRWSRTLYLSFFVSYEPARVN
ncbi:DUF983 domain-containing protein [Chitinophaga oryziterrae]|uniref:DUF983 domain-containing protein n=2 Tax=Chitinophaga oryziterrae TaxID=1031224 RepID=A0A6N8J6T3_9BACT|nr:DUF983 domain-containing protein [Chitinophaga oryziterrae]